MLGFGQSGEGIFASFLNGKVYYNGCPKTRAFVKYLDQGFVKGDEFCWSYFYFFFYESRFVKPNQLIDIVNQSEASNSELKSY